MDSQVSEKNKGIFRNLEGVREEASN